jgi:tetratricopeptide (TPR) repeat protein
LKIREAIGDRQGQGINYNNIGRVYMELNDCGKARAYFLRAEKIARQIKEKEIRQRVAISLGEMELVTGWDEKARQKSMIYADQALKLADEMKSKSGRAEALLLQARIFSVYPPFIKGDRGDFNGKFLEAIRIFKELKQPFDLARAYFYRAQGLGFSKEGIKDLQKAKQIFTNLGAKGWLAKVKALADGPRSR